MAKIYKHLVVLALQGTAQVKTVEIERDHAPLTRKDIDWVEDTFGSSTAAYKAIFWSQSSQPTGDFTYCFVYESLCTLDRKTRQFSEIRTLDHKITASTIQQDYNNFLNEFYVGIENRAKFTFQYTILSHQEIPDA